MNSRVVRRTTRIGIIDGVHRRLGEHPASLAFGRQRCGWLRCPENSPNPAGPQHYGEAALVCLARQIAHSLHPRRLTSIHWLVRDLLVAGRVINRLDGDERSVPLIQPPTRGTRCITSAGRGAGPRQGPQRNPAGLYRLAGARHGARNRLPRDLGHRAFGLLLHPGDDPVDRFQLGDLGRVRLGVVIAPRRESQVVLIWGGEGCAEPAGLRLLEVAPAAPQDDLAAGLALPGKSRPKPRSAVLPSASVVHHSSVTPPESRRTARHHEIRWTHWLRQSGASKGSAKYCVSWMTLPSRNSMMLTV